MSDLGVKWRSKARDEFELMLETLSAEWEQDRREARAESRRELSEGLNQGMRRLRQARSVEEAAGLSGELARPFAARCAVFLFRDGNAEAAWATGLGDEPLRFSPNDGAAFRAAIETSDPVMAVSIPSEISAALAERIPSETGTERAYLFPVAARGAVKAVLFGAGEAQPATLELIAGMTAMQFEALEAPAATGPRPDLLKIDLLKIQGVNGTERSREREPKGWTELSPELQGIHLRAQRKARLRVAEMRLERAEQARVGLERKDVYGALRGPIDEAREEFRREFMERTPTMVDYLYLELVRGLARDEESLLGPEFPGPLAGKALAAKP